MLRQCCNTASSPGEGVDDDLRRFVGISSKVFIILITHPLMKTLVPSPPGEGDDEGHRRVRFLEQPTFTDKRPLTLTLSRRERGWKARTSSWGLWVR